MTPLLYLMACLMSPAPLIHLAESRVLRSYFKNSETLIQSFREQVDYTERCIQMFRVSVFSLYKRLF
jgi:hypothetical protein